ncbi:MAG: ExbD/TolR family protein [Flavobacteriales bacterium]
MAIRSNQKISPNFNMSSMTDLVFLLLIFFILTSTLVSINALEIELPSADKTKTEQTYTTVSISNTGEYFVNSDKVDDLETLESSIGNAIIQAKDSTIVVRADKTAQVEQLVNVMNIGQRHHYKMVIATEIEK